MIKLCLICKKDFYIRPSHISLISGKYCSRKCCNMAQIGRKASLITKLKMSLIRTGRRTKEFTIYKHPDGYYNIYVPEHPFAKFNGSYPLHRYVAEAYLCRFLDPEEIIHHIDENLSNNLPENLYLFKSTGEHTQYHNFRRYRNISPIEKSNLLKN